MSRFPLASVLLQALHIKVRRLCPLCGGLSAMGGRCSHSLGEGEVEVEAVDSEQAYHGGWAQVDVFCCTTAQENTRLRLLLQRSSAELRAARSELQASQAAADSASGEVMALRSQLQLELQKSSLAATEQAHALHALATQEEQAAWACTELGQLREKVSELSEMTEERSVPDRKAWDAAEAQDRCGASDPMKKEPFPDWTALSRSLCAVCLEPCADRVAVPCGHQCVCEHCLTDLDQCPVCRHPVNHFLKVFVACPAQFEKECAELQSQIQAESRLRVELCESLAHEEARNEELTTEAVAAKAARPWADRTTWKSKDFQQLAKATRRSRELDKLLWPQTARCHGEILSNQTMVDFQRHLATLPRPALRR